MKASQRPFLHWTANRAAADFLAVTVLLTLVTGSVAWGQNKSADGKCGSGTKIAACSEKGSAPPAQGAGSSSTPVPAGAAFPFPTEDSQREGAGAVAPVPPQNGLPAMPTDAVPDPPASSERPLSLPPGYGGSSSSSGDGGTSGTTGSSSSRAAEDDGVAPTAAAADAPIKSSALKDLGSRGDTSAARARLEQTRVTDDLKVGSFYMKDGNTQGAYLRYKDAVEHAPHDSNIRFILAQAAQKLNKNDEAVANYTACLRLDPGGDHDKESRKALSRLGAKAR